MDNSFRYMLEYFRKGGKPAQRKAMQKKNCRKTEPGLINWYFFQKLDEDQRKVYDMLVQGLEQMLKTIEFTGVVLSQSRFDQVWDAVWGDHPEMFWVSRRYYDFAPGSTEDHITGILPYYTSNAEERQERQAAVDEALSRFTEGITAETGDYEAALLVYERIAQELDYDSLALEAQDRRRKILEGKNQRDNIPDDLRSVYGALVQKKAVCAGYARAFQYIMQKLGIECMYVRGDCSPDGRHAWNIVKLEGDYYHVDVTWGDWSNTDPSRDQDGYGYEYFCVTDQDIFLSRTIDTYPPVPACTAVSCNYYVRSGLFFETYDHQVMKARLLELLKDPQRTRVDMRFANTQVMEAVRQHMGYNGGMYELLRASGRKEQYSIGGYERFHILTFYFPKGEDQVDNA